MYKHREIIGKEVVILKDTFQSKGRDFDGIVVEPKYDSDAVFVYVYFIGSVVPLERSLIRTAEEQVENAINAEVSGVLKMIERLKEMGMDNTSVSSIVNNLVNAGRI